MYSHWTALLVSSCFEIGWLYSIKHLSINKIRSAPWGQALENTSPWIALLPLLGYVVFGLGNVYFLSVAAKHISMATAFAVWTGLVLVGTKILDTFVLDQPVRWGEMLFLSLIVLGVVGLRVIDKGMAVH
jgi:quaternary ammonium compound-resistance protein SugE